MVGGAGAGDSGKGAKVPGKSRCATKATSPVSTNSLQCCVAGNKCDRPNTATTARK